MGNFPGGYPAASTVAGSDKLLIAQGGETKEASVADVIAAASAAASTAATAASTAQSTANSAVTAAAAAQSTANDAAADAATAQAAAEDAQDAAEAAASAAASAAATASTVGGTASSAASAAAAAQSNATAALTAANAANTAASAASTNASAALTQAAAAQSTANSAVTAAAAAQTAADDAQAEVDELESVVLALAAQVSLNGTSVLGTADSPEITSSTAVEFAGLAIPVISGRRYFYTLLYAEDGDAGLDVYMAGKTATVSNLVEGFQPITISTPSKSMMNLIGSFVATSNGLVQAYVKCQSGVSSSQLIGKALLHYRFYAS